MQANTGSRKPNGKILDEIFSLYTERGDEEYYGEAVSKLEHSIQCGMLAERDGARPEIVLGAFFHDVGHMVGTDQGVKRMETGGTHLGSFNHAVLGAEYLSKRGFGSDVTDVVRFHVQAKRYLCYADPDFHDKLSWASKKTLELQGGPMNETQAEKFQDHPDWKDFIRMRHWDDEAKDPNLKNMKTLQYFRDLAEKYLSSHD